MLVYKGHGACLLIATSYISSLYLIPQKVRQSSRDNSTHIRYRILAASLSTILSAIICQRYFQSWNFPPHVTFLMACGLRFDTALDAVFRTCLLMIIFYSGPLISSSTYQYIFSHYHVDDFGNIGEKKGKNKRRNIFAYLSNNIASYRNEYGDLIIMRNIFFAPISEEFAFRALMIPALCAAYYFSGSDETINSNSSDNNRVDYNKFDSIDVNSFNPKSEISESNAINTQKTEITMSLIFTVLRTSYNIFTYYCVPALSTYSPWKVVLTCPLWFVLAHVHHCVEKIKNGQTVKQAILSTIVQASYTSIFGIIAALFFMRTGNILAPITSHIICNFNGLPNMAFLRSPSTYGSTEYSCMYAWRYYLLFLHALGLLLFSFYIFPFTEVLAEHSIYWGNLLSIPK